MPDAVLEGITLATFCSENNEKYLLEKNEMEPQLLIFSAVRISIFFGRFSQVKNQITDS